MSNSGSEGLYSHCTILVAKSKVLREIYIFELLFVDKGAFSMHIELQVITKLKDI